MMVLIVLAALSLTPSEVQTGLSCDTVDLVEVNHYYDDHGTHVFDQLIFYDWHPEQARYHVRAWRLLKSPAQVPQRDWQRGGYRVLWHDSEVLRWVQSRSHRETWTQYDPEMVERSYLPKEQRRRLYTPRLEAQQGEGA